MITDPLMLPVWAAALGLLIASLMRPRTKPGTAGQYWFYAGMFFLAADLVLGGLAITSILPEQMQRWQHLRLALSSFIPVTLLAITLTQNRANARECLREWRWILAAIGLLPVAILIASGGRLAGSVARGDELYWTIPLLPAGLFLVLIDLVGMILLIMQYDHTLRSAVGITRWRIKYLIAGMLIVAAVRIYADAIALITHAILPAILPLNAMAIMAAAVMMILSFRRSSAGDAALYVSTRVAIHSMILVIAGLFLFALGVTARLFNAHHDHRALVVWSLVLIGGLAIAELLMLSERVHLFVRHYLARHWRRPMHDYREVWLAFNEHTSKATSTGALARAVSGLLSRTFAALSVSIWLDDEGKQLHRVASTFAHHGRDETSSSEDISAAWHVLVQHKDPVNLAGVDAPWTRTLRAAHVPAFAGSGPCYAMALHHENVSPGFIIVGDRVNGSPMTTEDLDLLKVIAGQTAMRLHAIQLAARKIVLEQAGAIQMMSAFLAHDLKNAASGLSLLRQNLPAHFHDADFRRDATDHLCATINRMHEIVGRLTQLRETIRVQPRPVDFREWFAGMLNVLASQYPGQLQWSDAPERSIRIDPEQMQGAVTNLVLNAREASPPHKPVEVSADWSAQAAVIRVLDQGVGMTEEFVAGKLFQPFQTTKKHGMGIGLFHARMIVEAHGGRIDVKSRPNEGTTFLVTLPVVA